VRGFFVAIARNQAISNGAHGPHLPASWRTLEILPMGRICQPPA
jgi:hypothetical protein